MFVVSLGLLYMVHKLMALVLPARKEAV